MESYRGWCVKCRKGTKCDKISSDYLKEDFEGIPDCFEEIVNVVLEVQSSKISTKGIFNNAKTKK